MAPELPFLAAAAVAFITGVRRSGGLPSNGIQAAIATAVLVIVASASANTKAAPLVRAFGIALLVAAVLGFGRALQSPPAPRRVASGGSTGGGAVVSSGTLSGVAKQGSKEPGKQATSATAKPTGPVAPTPAPRVTRGGTF